MSRSLQACLVMASVAAHLAAQEKKDAEPVPLTAKTLKVGAVGHFHAVQKDGTKKQFRIKLVQKISDREAIFSREEGPGVNYELHFKFARRRGISEDMDGVTGTYKVTKKERVKGVWRLTVDEVGANEGRVMAKPDLPPLALASLEVGQKGSLWTRGVAEAVGKGVRTTPSAMILFRIASILDDNSMLVRAPNGISVIVLAPTKGQAEDKQITLPGSWKVKETKKVGGKTYYVLESIKPEEGKKEAPKKP